MLYDVSVVIRLLSGRLLDILSLRRFNFCFSHFFCIFPGVLGLGPFPCIHFRELMDPKNLMGLKVTERGGLMVALDIWKVQIVGCTESSLCSCPL